MRKAGAVVLLLCMTLLMAEFKGYGQSIWEKLKLPKLPEPPPIHEQTGGGAQPTPPKSENALEQTPSVAEQPAAPSTVQQAADTAAWRTSLVPSDTAVEKNAGSAFTSTRAAMALIGAHAFGQP